MLFAFLVFVQGLKTAGGTHQNRLLPGPALPTGVGTAARTNDATQWQMLL